MYEDPFALQIPGPFVISQGLPGDGLLNTIDDAPDFDFFDGDNDDDGDGDDGGDRSNHDDCDDHEQQQHQRHQQHHTFLGQGLSGIVRSPAGIAGPASFPRPPPPATPTTTTTTTTTTNTTTTTSSSFQSAQDDLFGLRNNHILNNRIRQLPGLGMMPLQFQYQHQQRQEQLDAPIRILQDYEPASNSTSTSNNTNNSTSSPFCSSVLASSFVMVQQHENEQKDQDEHDSLQTQNIDANDNRTSTRHKRDIAIQHWQDQCVAKVQQQAKEWLEKAANMLEYQQHLHQTTTQIPILYKLTFNNNHRWWIDDRTARLRVFDEFPHQQLDFQTRGNNVNSSSSSSSSNNNKNLPPGTVVVATALHSFDLLFHERNIDGNDYGKYNENDIQNTTNYLEESSLQWKYNGEYQIGSNDFVDGKTEAVMDASRSSFQRKSLHIPKSGRLQYLRLESPVEGFVVFSVDGYTFLYPGVPSSPIFTGVNDEAFPQQQQQQQHREEERHIHNLELTRTERFVWWWKVTCHTGAVLRRGHDLNSPAVLTLPFGAHVLVLKKIVNSMGLRRLLVRHIFTDTRNERREPPRHATRIVEGWCSECLNPLSTMRGEILQPIPLAVPVLYQLVQSALVRQSIELSSTLVRTMDVSESEEVPVLSRVFTDFPSHNCVQRLKLGEKAWASNCLNTAYAAASVPEIAQVGDVCSGVEDYWHLQVDQVYRRSMVLRPTGKIDGSFADHPGLYHFANYLKWKPFFGAHENTNIGNSNATLPTQNNEDDDQVSNAGHSSSCASLSSLESMDPVAEISDSVMQEKDVVASPLCMCCYDQVANATLVHGETGHICCCLACGRKCQAEGIGCPICRLPIDQVILHFYS